MPRTSISLALAIAVLAASAGVAPDGANAAGATPEDQVLNHVNAARGASGLGPLAPSPSLARASSTAARRLVARHAFGHLAMRAGGGFRVVGEVLAIHRGRRPLVERVMSAWIQSPAHRKILLSGTFRYLGVGRATGIFGGRRMTIWVARLGRR